MEILKHFGPSDFYTLEMYGDHVTDDRIGFIGGLRDLRQLNILAAKVSLKGLDILENFDNLRILSLRGCRVDKQVMETVVKMKNLERLDLRDTKVSDSTAAHLVKLKNLKSLKLDDSTVSNVSLLLISKTLPECDVWPEIKRN